MRVYLEREREGERDRKRERERLYNEDWKVEWGAISLTHTLTVTGVAYIYSVPTSFDVGANQNETTLV